MHHFYLTELLAELITSAVSALIKIAELEVAELELEVPEFMPSLCLGEWADVKSSCNAFQQLYLKTKACPNCPCLRTTYS